MSALPGPLAIFQPIRDLATTLLDLFFWSTGLRTLALFAYNCFIKPFLPSSFHAHGDGQKGALDAFYQGQAEVYDASRRHLLKGRETMLQLMASHLKAQLPPVTGRRMEKPKIWVDIGGGTGWNIEKM